MRELLPRAALALALLLVAGAGDAKERVALEIDWSDAPVQGAAERVSGPEGEAALRVASNEDHTTTHPLVTIESPPVGGVGYAVLGRVRHEGVKGEAYLEMWSYFADGGRYFSRTLGQGPMAPLRGDGDWRAFQLPFFLNGAPAPSRLQVNLVLPGAGRVWIGPLQLVQLDPRGAAAGAWWSDTTAGWVGGILGSAVGLLGAAIGTLCSLGRGRAFVLGALRFGIVLGVVLAAGGAWAWLSGQPYGVWYPLLLVGVICAVVDAAVLPGARRRFEEIELRRMRARDVEAGAHP